MAKQASIDKAIEAMELRKQALLADMRAQAAALDMAIDVMKAQRPKPRNPKAAKHGGSAAGGPERVSVS